MTLNQLYKILGTMLQDNDGLTDVFVGDIGIESLKLIREYDYNHHGKYIEIKLENKNI